MKYQGNFHKDDYNRMMTGSETLRGSYPEGTASYTPAHSIRNFNVPSREDPLNNDGIIPKELFLSINIVKFLAVNIRRSFNF